jgi:hypothetical protein
VKKIETKVAEIQTKYQKLVKTVSEQSKFFLDVSAQLTDFVQVSIAIKRSLFVNYCESK